jgi:hypothetical protein
VTLARRSEQDGSREFWVDSPFEDRADRGVVDRLLSTLAGLQAGRFGDDASAEAVASLNEAPEQISVRFDGAGMWTLSLGAPVAEGSDLRYARLGGPTSSEPVVEIGGELAELLAKAPDAWRSKAWSAFEVWQVDDVTLRDAQGTLELRRDSTDWQRGEERIPFTAVNDLLARLSEAEADEVVTAEPSGEPVLIVELTGSEGRTEALALYPAAGEHAAATVGGREVTLQLPAETLTAITEAIAAIRAAQSLPDDEADVLAPLDPGGG